MTGTSTSLRTRTTARTVHLRHGPAFVSVSHALIRRGQVVLSPAPPVEHAEHERIRRPGCPNRLRNEAGPRETRTAGGLGLRFVARERVWSLAGRHRWTRDLLQTPLDEINIRARLVKPFWPSRTVRAYNRPPGSAPARCCPHVDLTVSFTDERLFGTGLRLVIAEDHLARCCGSTSGTGVSKIQGRIPARRDLPIFFEHVMFEGSQRCEAAHRSSRRPRHDEWHDWDWHQLLRDGPVAPVWRCGLRPTGLGTLLDALSQENLDNQREVVRTEKRWSYHNWREGLWNEKIQAHPLPARASVPPHLAHRSMSDLETCVG